MEDVFDEWWRWTYLVKERSVDDTKEANVVVEVAGILVGKMRSEYVKYQKKYKFNV